MAKKKYTPQSIVDGFKQFYAEHGRYPNALDTKNSDYLPNMKTIERRYGGVIAFRKQFGLADPDGYYDSRSSSKNKETIKGIIKRSYEEDGTIYDILVNRFGKLRVHRQDYISTGLRQRCDFRIFMEDETEIVIDIFNPARKESLLGCLNIKINKYKDLDHNFWFVCTNKEITENDIQDIIKKKKKKIPTNMQLMSYSKFLKSIV